MSISTDSTNSVEFSSDDCGESFIDQQKLKQIGEKFTKMELVLKNTKFELKNKRLQEKLKEYEMSALLAKIEAENGKMKNEIDKMQAKMDEKEEHLEKKLEELQKKSVEMWNEQTKSTERMEKKTLQEELEKKLMELIVTLETKVDKMEMENQKQKEKALFERIGELEGQQKHQKQQGEKETNELVGQIKQLKDEQKKFLERVNELEKHQKQMQQEKGEHEKKLMEQIVTLQTKVDKMEMVQQKQKVSILQIEHLQNEQKRKNNAMEDNNEKQMHMALLNFQKNCWDAKACHNDIEITEFTAHCNTGKELNGFFRTVFATHPIWLDEDSPDFFYFEISVKNMQHYPLGCFDFGFAAKQQNKLEGTLVRELGTYAYLSQGFFTINGKWLYQKEQKVNSYTENDIVGCGVNWATRQIFFTKNGRRQGPFYLVENSPISVPADELFPFVSLCESGDKIEANFGPNFKFNLATLC